MSTLQQKNYVINGTFMDKMSDGMLKINTPFCGNVNVELCKAEMTDVKMILGTSVVCALEQTNYCCNITDNMTKPSQIFNGFEKDVVKLMYTKDGVTTIVLSGNFYVPIDVRFEGFPFDIPEFVEYVDFDFTRYKALQFNEDIVVHKENTKDICTISYSNWKQYECIYTSTMTIQDVFNMFDSKLVESVVVTDNITTVVIPDIFFLGNKDIFFYNFPFEIPKKISRPVLHPEDSAWRTLKFVKEKGSSIPSENLFRYVTDFVSPLNFQLCGEDDYDDYDYMGEMSRYDENNSKFHFVQDKITTRHSTKNGIISLRILETNTGMYLTKNNVIDNFDIYMKLNIFTDQ